MIVGSVQKIGDRVRITAQLVHAATDRHLWAKSYERELTDVLSLQSEIARSVASEVGVALSPQEQTRLAAAKPVDPEVHDLYLKGLFHSNRGTEEELGKAIVFFEQALAKDAHYAPALAGLSDSYLFLSDRYRPPSEVMPKAEAAAKRALELDESLAEAHSALTTVRLQWYLGLARRGKRSEACVRAEAQLRHGALPIRHRLVGDGAAQRSRGRGRTSATARSVLAWGEL